MMKKCLHCKVPGEYPLDRCDTCAAAHHNHNFELCMACHPEDAVLIGVGSGIMAPPTEAVYRARS